VQTALLPASVAYGLGSYVRTIGYASSTLRRTKLPVPVISIGNLTCGGTGKTPVTIQLAAMLIKQGLRVAVLSRGYKRQSKAPYLVVSDGKELLVDCRQSGDEPYLMAKALPAAIIIVGSDRVLTGNIAIRQFSADVLLLDDGFQHIRLKRDRDLVLVDYNEDLDEQYLLPAGRLREPVSAIGRATSIAVTKVPIGCDPEKMAKINSLLRKYNNHADISYCQFRPVASANIRAARVLAFCGIAKPEPFFQSVERLGATLVKSVRFPDHHWFTGKELACLEAEAAKHKADYLITTEKDLVRIAEPHQAQCPIITIKLETVWLGEPPQVTEQLPLQQQPPLVSTR
jgi:tetraacyldisaccharide 4'-kinase